MCEVTSNNNKKKNIHPRSERRILDTTLGQKYQDGEYEYTISANTSTHTFFTIVVILKLENFVAAY